MGWLNGRNGAGADTPAAVTDVAKRAEPVAVPASKNGITTELARFLPVMDLEQAIARRELIVSAMQRLMKEGVDYGKIPGTERPTLLQPGADKLCNLFGLVIKYEVEVCDYH